MTVSLFSGKATNRYFLPLHTLRNTYVGLAAAFRFIFFCLFLLLTLQGYTQTALIPASDGGFENATATFTANNWTVVNDNNNKWYIGTAVKYAGTNGAYIDNYNGSTNKYTTSNDNTSHFYRDIVIPSGATNLSLTFMLKGSGEIGYDRLLVYTAPTTVTPVAGTPAQWTSTFPGATLIYTQSAFYTVFTNQLVSLPNSLAGTTVRLIFTWQNDNNTGSNPPAAIDNISLTYMPCTSPALTFSTTQSCVGGSTGTITATGSGGQAPYTYSIDGVTYQPGNSFSGLAAGNYTLYIRSNSGCGTSLPVTVNEYAASAGDQTLAGTNSWIGHMYDGTNFNTYIGTFTETESFDETFGGNTTCYPVTSSSGSSSIYTETFSARLRMNSTKNGLYTFSLGSDDGSRLYVDGSLIYNNWNDHALSSSPSVLMNLSGNSSLVYEYYENGGANEVVFQNPKLILANNLSTNISQTICSGGTSSTISGDSFGLLPSGLSNGTYQWGYSTTPGGTLTTLTGTSATFKPDLTKAPFNTPGTYYVYRSASVTSTNNTGFASYTATNLSNAATIIIGSTPAITASSTPTCVGAPYGTGTITIAASGGSIPYTYTLNGGSNQATNTFSALAAGTYTVGVISNAGCTASGSVTVIPYPNSTDDTTAIGTDSWIGHTYSGMNFQNYKGHFTESETFNEGFGGNLNCFTISSGATTPSIYTEQFSVRFKMKSTKKGLYVVDLGSDDGSRLSVDGTLVYNNWVDQSFSTKPRVLMNLTGSSLLQYDFYENAVNNQVVFLNLTQVLANNLSANTTQSICIGSSAATIAGDTYGMLPGGLSLSGTGYQWTYSTTPTGARTNIAGATAATLTPNTAAAPFNVPGTYYVYRNASVISTNNTGFASYTVTNESNAATITVNLLPGTPTISASGSTTFCAGGSVTLTSSAGTGYLWSTGATTQSINVTTAGNYSVKVTNAGVCQSSSSAATVVTVNSLPATPTITAGGPTTFCAGGNVTLTSSAGTSYLWSTGATTASINVTTTGNYSVKVTNAGGCQSTASAATVVTVNSLPATPTISAGGPTTFCAGGSVTLTASTGAGYLWSTGATTASISPTASGSYSVKVINASGCQSASSTATVITVTTPPSATISYPGSPYCSSSGTATATLSGTTGGVFTSDAGLIINASTGVVTLSTSTPGNHTVTYTVASAGGCAAFSTTTNITITQQPSASGFYPASPYCSNMGTLVPTGSQTGLMGTLSSDAGLSINPSTGVINVTASTQGLHTIIYSVPAFGGCNAYSTSADITISTAPNATISYGGSPYCSGAGTAMVTKGGSGTGTFSSTVGLIIDATSGVVDLNASTTGTYTVTYTVPAGNGCAAYKTTTSIVITPKVQTPSFALGTSSVRCQGAGTVTYTATAGNSTAITYTLDATSLAGGNTINSSTGAVTYNAAWNGISTITATAAGCSPLTATHVVTISAIPSVSATSPLVCVGGTGTITLNGSGGLAPYTYSLNGSAYQSSGVFSNLSIGAYTVNVKSAAGCTATTSVAVNTYSNSTDDQTTAGNNSWIGHIYNGKAFDNYIGYFTETEQFAEVFGGDATCFPVSSSSGTSSVYTEKFSVRFNMNSTKKGLYIVDLGSDDGSKLTIDGNIVYNNWTDQAFNTKPRVLINLTGSSVLNYEYYENGGANKVVFQNLTLVLANTLSTNTTQGICAGNSGTAISGDSFGTLPTGLSNAGYQWTYSLSAAGARMNINGATSATLTPDPSVAPFNNAGTYYIYRNAIVTSSNNTGLNPYTVSNESNAAIITITATPNASISYVDAPFCNSISTAESVTISGTTGGQFTATGGLTINAATGAIIPSANAIGNYTVTYTVPATGGCTSFTTTTDVNIGAPGAWSGRVNTDWNNAGNWLCGQIPSSTTDAIIPKYVTNFPMVISNTAEAKDVIVRSGASLVITGTIKVAGAISNSGSIDASAGTLEMNGSSAQTIAGSMFKNKLIKNLVVSNTSASGLSVSSTANDTLKISGSLSFGAATSKLYTGNNITLVSNNTGTANVGMLATGNSISGNVTVERFINTGTATGQHGKSWQFLATPVTGLSVKQTWMENGVTTTNYGTQITGPGGTAAGFDAYTATPSMKYYNSQNDTWTGITNTNNPVYGQNGYMLFVRGDRTVTAYNQPATATVLRTSGTLLTGTLPSISVTPDKLQSVGNPYASVVDFTLITKDASIDNLFYVWDPYLSGAYGLGGYQTLSAANGWKPVPGGTVSYPTGIPCTVIESGQAFFVHATGSAQMMNAFSVQGNALTFTESCKAAAAKAGNFARVSGNITNNKAQFFRVSLFTGSGPGAVMADGNSVAFDERYSNNIDGNDAMKLLNSGENFGIKRAGKTLSIESRSLPNTTDTIFYSMSNMAQRTYQLRFLPENMQSAGIQAFLLDKFSNTSTPLSLTDSSFVNVSITSNAASAAADRFKVVFRQMNALPVTFISIKATQKDKAVVVEWNVENESEMQQYEVEKSADGASFLQVGTVTPLNKGAKSYTWTDTKPFEGNNYYRIKRVSKDGQISYTKIIRVVVGKIVANISVYPNPITDGAIRLQMSNVPAGAYAVKLTNSIGQVIFAGKITHSENNSIETISVRHLAKGIYQLEVIKPDGRVQLISVLY